jgi:hypothetical protein
VTAGADITTRMATPDDAAPLTEAFGDERAFRRLFEGDAGLLVVCGERDGAIACALAVETTGHPVQTAWAWVSGSWPGDGPVEAALYRAAVEAFGPGRRGLGSPPALAAPIAVGDRAGARTLEEAGFRPRGGAYRVLGPGMVEYLDGYTDPQGFLVDFVRELGADA